MKRKKIPFDHCEILRNFKAHMTLQALHEACLGVNTYKYMVGSWWAFRDSLNFHRGFSAIAAVSTAEDQIARDLGEKASRASVMTHRSPAGAQ